MMIIITISILAVGLATWGVIAHLGRSQSLSVKSIENPSGNVHLIRLTKPGNMTWNAGSYAKIKLPEVADSEQNSRWLTIASTSDENEILILTHNSGSLYKKTLTSLSAGSKVEMSWLESNLSVTDGSEPLICFASDVGISAMRPIVRQWAGKRPVALNHLDKGVVVFDKEMKELSKQKDNFSYETSDSLSRSQESLKKAAGAHGNKATYLLAGQPDDVNAMKKFLQDNGIDARQIKSSMFRGLK